VKVLSLFNGISCGRVALERANIPVERYVSYEIDKYANMVAQDNYPNDTYLGDVFEATYNEGEFDILIGGSPCTYWSIAKKDRETTSDGIGFQLFMQYVRALHEAKPKYFLYENNYSIHKDIKAEITKALGVEPIMINSALVSAQQRKRCYWTNIPNVQQPQDKGILLKDILENNIYQKNNTSEKYLFKNLRTANEKSVTLTASSYKGIGSDGMTTVAVPICVAQRGRYLESNNRSVKCEGGTYQAIEPRTDGKTNCLTTVQKDNLVCEPIRIGQIGKGGQGQRIYSVRGKSITIASNSGGLGSNTGLYKIDLPDGDYIIRKLTPIEAERLQTLPDNYTKAVSNTQRYKGVGNGWTVDVIAHILSYIPKEDY